MPGPSTNTALPVLAAITLCWGCGKREGLEAQGTRGVVVEGAAPIPASQANAVLVDEQFEMPPGFHIYRAAGRELTGGSYALRFDGQGRLLVGEGTELRRLEDGDEDGVFDSFEVLATDLGWRGPQGILVYDDRLFVVGGDGIQLYEGYSAGGPLRHVGRIGAELNTGDDHDAHTLLRGHDGYVYFMAGNSSGLRARDHINVESSPCLVEREASVFRISPDGKHWECIGNGGRNPPNLGMNYLGELFSFDSDMEWHLGLPWYRPTRLNHWVTGGDQGWQDVDAYPSYYIDNLPGILDVGRGSPTWGAFYEHLQFPEKYKNAFIVCDYPRNSDIPGGPPSNGRLLAFHLWRSGSRWKAEVETLIQPKPDARDNSGRAIRFSVVDIDIAPDGSIYVTDHDNGIWRIFYDPDAARIAAPKPIKAAATTNLRQLLDLPQPGAEWSRVTQGVLYSAPELAAVALDGGASLQDRLRAIRFLAADASKRGSIAPDLARDSAVEMRAQAAWLAGLSDNGDKQLLARLLRDPDAFVRRRAAEGFTRNADARFAPALVRALGDPDRSVRYVAMLALAHLPASVWFSTAVASSNNQVRLRALTAAHLRAEPLAAADVKSTLVRVLGDGALSREDVLDVLRVVALYRDQVKAFAGVVMSWARRDFPSLDSEVDWERARLLGEFKDPSAFPALLQRLLTSADDAQRFHYFQAIARLSSGWTRDSENRLLDWVVSSQDGWLARFKDSSLFLEPILDEFTTNHSQAFLEVRGVVLDSVVGSAWLRRFIEDKPNDTARLYFAADASGARAILHAARNVRTERTAGFLQSILPRITVPELRQMALDALAVMPKYSDTTQPSAIAAGYGIRLRADAEVYDAFAATAPDAGDVVRGRLIYERLGCAACHRGVDPIGGAMLGPDLTGVTSRLSRTELAEAIVYPSKRVGSRFRAVSLTLKDGRTLTGFITDRAAGSVTLAQAGISHRLPEHDIQEAVPEQKSLMPDGLGRTLSDAEIGDLVRFLAQLGGPNSVQITQ